MTLVSLSRYLPATTIQHMLIATMAQCWPPYARCTIEQKIVPIDEIFPLSRRLRRHRLTRAHRLARQYLEAAVPLYQPSITFHDGFVSLILPPILEKHDAQHLIVDGAHRVLVAIRMNELPRQLSATVISGILPPPAARPSEWSTVRVIEHHPSIEELFAGYQPELFRPVAEYFRSGKWTFPSLGHALSACLNLGDLGEAMAARGPASSE